MFKNRDVLGGTNKMENIINQIFAEMDKKERIAQSERHFRENVLFAGAFDKILSAQAQSNNK